MNRWSTVPLESYELIQYAVQVNCYICDGGNRFDAEFCRHCRAPLALAYQPGKKKSQPLLLSIWGGAGAGKTSYLGLLTDILSRQPGGLHMLAHGACSVLLQQQTIAALSRRQFPHTTPTDPEGWRWVHSEVRLPSRKRALDLVLPDVSGRAIEEEIETPQRQPAIRRLFTKSSAAMILVEADRGPHDRPHPEFLGMKIVSELLGVAAPKRQGWAHRPVAIVFTKSDRQDAAFDSPDQFARNYAPGLWRQCSESLKNVRFFATSIATVHVGIDGFGDRLAIPMRVEPRGVVEPFAWLAEQLVR